MSVSETDYGFKWGSMEVTRILSHEGYKAVTVGPVDDPDRSVEIYVSPKGKSVRVFRKGMELK